MDNVHPKKKLEQVRYITLTGGRSGQYKFGPLHPLPLAQSMLVFAWTSYLGQRTSTKARCLQSHARPGNPIDLGRVPEPRVRSALDTFGIQGATAALLKFWVTLSMKLSHVTYCKSQSTLHEAVPCNLLQIPVTPCTFNLLLQVWNDITDLASFVSPDIKWHHKSSHSCLSWCKTKRTSQI